MVDGQAVHVLRGREDKGPEVPRRVGIPEVAPSREVEDVEGGGEVDGWGVGFCAEGADVDAGVEGLGAGFAADLEEGRGWRSCDAAVGGGEVADFDDAWLGGELPDLEAEFGGEVGEEGE